MKKIKVTKYNGLGNDFIITADANININKVCNRNFGVGADGLIIDTIKDGHFFMKFFNQDGSIAKMCGNGIRCYAQYIYEKYGMNTFKINTLAGMYDIKIKKISDVEAISVVSIPAIKDGDVFEILGFKCYRLNTGANHIVIVKDITIEDIESCGKLLCNEYDCNINFVSIDKIHQKVKLTTYERGVGITLACGTGAIATSYILNKYFNFDKIVTVEMPGGNLVINLENMTMTGKSQKTFEGEYYEI